MTDYIALHRIEEFKMGVIQTMFSAKSAKAFVAAVLAAISTATVASAGGFTVEEMLSIFGAAVFTFQATFWVSNGKTPPDGTIELTETDGKKLFSLVLDSDPEDLGTKKQVVFKVENV